MTPQHLKNSILQLAIQGKLVEQRPEEGVAVPPKPSRPACRSPKSSVRSPSAKDKPLPPITDDELPFDIPESWRWVRMGSVGSWGSGATPSRTKPEYYGGTIPWLKTGDLNDGYISDVPEKITELALTQTSVRMNPAGSVLMAMYGATIGKLGIITVPMTTNQACCACAPYEGIYNRYLFFFLLARRQAFIKMGEGGAQPNISKEKIVNSLIPLPPLAEQKRIVSKIEELLPLIARYEQAWTKLEAFNARFPADLQKSLLQLAIQGKLVEQRPEEGTGEDLYRQIQSEKLRLVKAGKIKKEKLLQEIAEDEIPFEIPESWKWVRLSSACLDLFSGKSPVYSKTATEYRIIGQAANQQAGLDYTQLKYTNADFWNSMDSRYFLREHDVLLNTLGNGTLGRSGYLENLPFPLLTDGHLFVFRTPDPVSSKYLYYYLQYTRTEIEKDADGSTNQTFLTLTKTSKWLFPLPPLAEQKRIVAKLEELLPLCERLK